MNIEGDNCQLLFQNETLLCEALQNRPSKIIIITVSFILTFVDALLLYGVIWYQKFGPDYGRTVIDEIFTSFCWACMVALPIGIADAMRYVIGPFPRFLCHLILFFKGTIRMEIILFYDMMAIFRYILIFHRKNPTSLDEKFWNRFTCHAITLVILIFNIVQEMMPTQKDATFYICCGADPEEDSKLPPKREGLILFLSLILQFFINARIVTLKHQDKLKKVLKLFQLSSCKSIKIEESNFNLSFDKDTIVNTSAICWGFIFSFAFYKLNVLVKSFSFEELNQYPNYIYLYILQLTSFQTFGLFMLITLYLRHDKLYDTLYRNWNE